MAGRPEGSVESPEKLLRLEVGSLLKQTRRLRSIIDGQIDYFEAQLIVENGLNLDGHILIVTTLKELQKESINTIKEGMKILDKDPSGKPVSGDDPEEVMREMQGGRG